MTPLSPARRGAEEFASVVDGTLADLDGRYADLLSYVDVMRAQEPPAPRPDFVANLRERLMDAADTLLLPADDQAPATVIAFPDAARRQRRQRRLSIAAAAFVVVGGTAGVAAAAQSALPGDPLYPIKRGIESAQVSFNSSDSGKGQDLLRQAGTRLDEVNGLISADRSPTQIRDTLSSYRQTATDGADLIFVSYQRSGDPQDITRLRTMLGSQLSLIDRLSGDAPAGTDSAFTDARNLITDLDQQARVLCGDCGSQNALSLGSLQLSSATPSLESLLVQPAERAQAAAAADAAQKLANQAEQTAKNTPKAPATETPKPTVSTPTPGLNLPGSGGTTTPVKSTVSGVTDGVTGLLDQVDQATGGATKPLTDAVNTTLNTLLGLLP
jgi:hypothetical protein